MATPGSHKSEVRERLEVPHIGVRQNVPLRADNTQRASTPNPGLPPTAAERPRMEPRGAALQDAPAVIASLDEVDLARFRVGGA